MTAALWDLDYDQVIPRKPCWHKTPHKTRKRALGAASYCSHQIGIPLYVYKCPHCHDYHLTKQPQRW